VDEPRADKVAVVTEAAVLTEYRGLNVAAMAELRDALRQAGGTYKIYKNTLVRLAARERGLEIDDLLTGPTAIAFVDGDAAGVAKALRDFAKANPALVVKGGLLGSSVLAASDVTALADLPSREQLLSEIAGLFAAPMQQFASLLDAVPRSFSYALNALIEAGGAPGAPVADETTPAADAATEATDEAADPTPPADAGTETTADPAETEES
jgi:large subunit ribosomal protein L10